MDTATREVLERVYKHYDQWKLDRAEKLYQQDVASLDREIREYEAQVSEL